MNSEICISASEIEDPAVISKLLVNEKENFKILAEKVGAHSEQPCEIVM